MRTRRLLRTHDCRGLVMGLMLSLAIAIVAWLPSEAQAAHPVVTGVTSSEVSAETHISITATQPVRYQLRDLRRDWIVVDIAGAELGIPAGQLPAAGGLVKKLRVGQFTSDTVRVVVELAQPLNFHVSTSNHNSTIIVRIRTDTSAHLNATQPQGTGQPTGTPPSDRIPTPQVPVVQTPATPPKNSGSPQGKSHVVTGQSIGPVKLGMTVKDISAITGPSRGTERMSDGTTLYRWFEPPANVGLGVRVTPAGTVYRIFVLNDPSYVTKEGLHAGSTEAEVRAALGEPSKVLINSQTKIKTLVYDALGVWFGIQLEERYTFYNKVFEIGVKEPK